MLTQSFKGGNNLNSFEFVVDPLKGVVKVNHVDVVEKFNFEDFCDIGDSSIVCNKFGVEGRNIHNEIRNFLSERGLL